LRERDLLGHLPAAASVRWRRIAGVDGRQNCRCQLSGQLADESGEPGEDAEEFLSDEQLAAYGCCTRPPTVDELDRFFVLDDEDRNLITGKRGTPTGRVSCSS